MSFRFAALLLMTVAWVNAQGLCRDSDAEREVSWKRLPANLACDQKNIWLFPVRAARGKNLVPTLAVIGTTAALVALDPHTAPYFRLSLIHI